MFMVDLGTNLVNIYGHYKYTRLFELISLKAFIFDEMH
jgi:hypothetical protein